MTNETGHSGSRAEVMTREVRWFFHGPLPGEFHEWFTSATHTREHRVDVYDLASARNGVGRKQRDDATLDTKYRVDMFQSVPIASGVIGHVEDWMKISESLKGAPMRPLAVPLPVDKKLFSRHYFLNDDPDSGCEVELSEIEVDRVAAWSLCFETFGNPEERGLAIQSCFDRFFTDNPLPHGFELRPEASVGYPDWISRLTSRAA